MPELFSYKLMDDAGEGPFRVVVFPDAGDNTKIPPILYVRFNEPARVGMCFRYADLDWQITEETLAKPGVIEAGDSFWIAKLASH